MTMEKERNTPSIRFKGFTDPWEQRRLGSIGSTFTGLSGKSKEDFGHGDASFVTYMNVYLNTVADLNMTEHVEIDPQQNQVRYGDVFFTTSSETPDEVGMSSVWLGNAKNVYLNSFCFGYRPQIEVNPYYFAYMLRSNTMRKKLIYLAQGISRYNISKNKVMEIKVPLPNIEEQQRVGNYFKNLDSLITLHQRKLDQEKKLKEYLLQNMFPKEGEDVPRIRFSGFNEPWEQRRLEEIFVFRYGDGNINPSDGGKYPVFGAGGVQGGYSQYNAEDSVIIGHMGDAGCVTWGNGKHFVTYNGTITKPKDNAFSAKFGYYLLLHMNLKKYRGGTGLPYLTYEMLNQMKTKSSTSVAETNLIAEILSDLDHLINLHQRKLESLKELKKGLLQKMFV